MVVDAYLELGWSMIPIRPRSKVPTGPWVSAQESRAPAAQVDAWIEEEYNLAVVTGALSNLVVVDCDSEDGVVNANRLGMSVTPTASTGKGRHYFFAHPGQAVRNAVRVVDDVDVRGDGGYVLIDPSIHPSGAEYRWVEGLSPLDVHLAPCPEWVLSGAVGVPKRRPEGAWAEAFSRQVREGSRNQVCAELAGYLLRKRVDVPVAEELLALWNDARVSPPMTRGEVSRTVRSIAAREERRRGG